MRRFLQVFYAIFSAFIFSLALQNELLPLGSPFLGIFALVPLYLAIRKADSYGEAALLTGLQVLITHLLSSFWLGFFQGYAIFTLGASALGTCIIGTAFGTLLYFFVGRAKKRGSIFTKTTPVLSVLFFAVVWTLYEVSKSKGFLGYPWGTILMSSYKWPLIIQIADITGTWGITFLFALFSAVVGEGVYLLCHTGFFYGKTLFYDYKWTAGLCISLFCCSVIYGAFQYTYPRVPQKFLKATLVQHNGDSWSSTEGEASIMQAQRLTEKAIEKSLKNSGVKPDVVVWSETVLSYAHPEAQTYYTYVPFQEGLYPFIERMQVPFLIGSPITINSEEGLFSNGVLYIDQHAQVQDYYAKIHLVPFAEAVPGTEYPWVRDFLESLIGFSSGWMAGTRYNLFEIPLESNQTVKSSTPICFEDAFPDICRQLYKAGSEVFVNLTNDSWSRTNSAEYQHFVISVFRAIEFRTTLVRSTNSGYTVVVDPRGKVIADLPLFESLYLNTNIPVYERTETLYYRLGEWFPILLTLITAACVILIRIKYD